MITDFFKFLTTYKKAISVALLSIALVYGAFCVKSWYNDQLTASYNSGVTVTDNKWKTKMEENEAEQRDYKNAQQIYVSDLSRQLEEARAKLSNPDTNGGTKQVIYLQKPESQVKGLDDDFVDIYNESLGVANEK